MRVGVSVVGAGVTVGVVVGVCVGGDITSVAGVGVTVGVLVVGSGTRPDRVVTLGDGGAVFITTTVVAGGTGLAQGCQDKRNTTATRKRMPHPSQAQLKWEGGTGGGKTRVLGYAGAWAREGVTEVAVCPPGPKAWMKSRTD